MLCEKTTCPADDRPQNHQQRIDARRQQNIAGCKCFDKTTCPAENCPKDCRHRLIVDRLSKLAEGILAVSFSPRAFLDDDEEWTSLGHVYMAFSSLDIFERGFDFDDRRPESLETQLASAMRQLAESCRKVADGIDECLAGWPDEAIKVVAANVPGDIAPVGDIGKRGTIR